MNFKRVYYIRNIVNRWKSEIAKADQPILVFSPYITSRTAETVLCATRTTAVCEVYTLFTPEVFATGSSSLQTLKRLSKAGLKLYHLPSIHAKVIIVKGQFASVGSQNITEGGKNRKEASVVTTCKREVDHIWKQVQEWCKVRTQITPEMIRVMETAIHPLIRASTQLRERCKELADEIATNEQERLQERRRQEEQRLEEERRERELEKQRVMREKIAEADYFWENLHSKSEDRVRARVSFSNSDYRSRSILRPISPADLTRWLLRDGRSKHLDRLSRYPCIIKNIWRFGFARVCQTRISRVHHSIKQEYVVIGNQACTVVFHAQWQDTTAPNLTCSVMPSRFTTKLEIQCWFKGDALEVANIELGNERSNTEHASESLKWFKSCQSEAEIVLLKHLLSPFVYEERLLGSEAYGFFGNRGTEYLLQLGVVDDNCIIVASEI